MATLRAFFDSYATAVTNNDFQAMSDHCAQDFIMTTVFGSTVHQNGAGFIASLKQASAVYRQIGMETARIASYDETRLDPLHALVKIGWSLHNEDGVEILDFDVSYVVRLDGERPAILLFIPHNEIQRMQERGLI